MIEGFALSNVRFVSEIHVALCRGMLLGGAEAEAVLKLRPQLQSRTMKLLAIAVENRSENRCSSGRFQQQAAASIPSQVAKAEVQSTDGGQGMARAATAPVRPSSRRGGA